MEKLSREGRSGYQLGVSVFVAAEDQWRSVR